MVPDTPPQLVNYLEVFYELRSCTVDRNKSKFS